MDRILDTGFPFTLYVSSTTNLQRIHMEENIWSTSLIISEKFSNSSVGSLMPLPTSTTLWPVAISNGPISTSSLGS